MEKLTFSTTNSWDHANGFGCASLGLAGICDNNESRVVIFPKEFESIKLTGSYETILSEAKTVANTQKVFAAIVVFGNAGGENAFLAQLQQIVRCPMVGGGAAIDGATGRAGLIPGNGPAAVLLITDDRYDYTVKTENIHTHILEECTLSFSEPRTILTINGVDAAQYLAQKRKELGLKDNDFEHLTISDLSNINAHLSQVEGAIKSGRDVHEKMLLRYVPHKTVQNAIQNFYDDPDAIVFGCAGLSGLLDAPLQTKALGLFLFGEVCMGNDHAEFGNLMLSKLIIKEKSTEGEGKAK